MEKMLATCILIYLISLWTVISNMVTTITFLASMLALLVAIGLLAEWVVSTFAQFFAWFQYPQLLKDLAIVVKFAAI